MEFAYLLVAVIHIVLMYSSNEITCTLFESRCFYWFANHYWCRLPQREWRQPRELEFQPVQRLCHAVLAGVYQGTT
ncbi:MAG: hypothetical protein ACMG6E_06390 [Candidatus Roizmanbacteria bacterium]